VARPSFEIASKDYDRPAESKANPGNLDIASGAQQTVLRSSAKTWQAMRQLDGA
jgi:hypothetical protein